VGIPGRFTKRESVQWEKRTGLPEKKKKTRRSDNRTGGQKRSWTITLLAHDLRIKRGKGGSPAKAYNLSRTQRRGGEKSSAERGKGKNSRATCRLETTCIGGISEGPRCRSFSALE